MIPPIRRQPVPIECAAPPPPARCRTSEPGSTAPTPRKRLAPPRDVRSGPRRRPARRHHHLAGRTPHQGTRPPSRAGGPLDAEGPAGIATTLRDAPPATTATGRTYGALVHRETRPEGSRWAFDIPVPGAVGQARRARPARVSEKPRSGRRGAGDRARRRGRRVAASGRHRRGVGEGAQLLARGRGRPAGDDVHVTVRLDGPPVQGRR